MIKNFIYKFFTFPCFLMYRIYDALLHRYTKLSNSYFGYGIHLYIGLFGKGKTCSMVYDAYRLACKYKNLHILTNIKLQNFPSWTEISKLNTVDDIINAKEQTLVLIDEIGTIFNSRDFMKSKSNIPKSLFQHLCQCRKRNICIFGTVQRYNLLDKQIRDITADVTVCTSFPDYPYTRYVSNYCYSIDDYEIYCVNRTYEPKPLYFTCFFQTNKIRSLYDTSELVNNMLTKDYLSDAEILSNRAESIIDTTVLDKNQNKSIRNRKKL